MDYIPFVYLTAAYALQGGRMENFRGGRRNMLQNCYLLISLFLPCLLSTQRNNNKYFLYLPNLCALKGDGMAGNGWGGRGML